MSSDNDDIAARQRAAAQELIGREARRSGRSVRAVLSLVRASEPPTRSECLLLAAVRLLGSPHVIMAHPCKSTAEWLARYGQIGGIYRFGSSLARLLLAEALLI